MPFFVKAQQTTYGPVQSNETLSEIAQKVRTDKRIPISKVIRALQDANPQAFANDDPRSLRVDSLLRVPALVYGASTPVRTTSSASLASQKPDQLSLSGVSNRQITESLTSLTDQVAMQASIIEKLAKRGEINQTQIQTFNASMQGYQQKIALMEAQLKYLESGQTESRRLLENSSGRIDGIHTLLTQRGFGKAGQDGLAILNIIILSLLLLMGLFMIWIQLRNRKYPSGNPQLMGAGLAERGAEPMPPPPSTAVQNQPVISERPILSADHGVDDERLHKRMQWLRVLAKVDEAERFRDEVIHLMAEMPIRDMPQWQQITTMGLRLSPGDRLYLDEEPEDYVSIKSEIESIKRQDASEKARAAALAKASEQIEEVGQGEGIDVADQGQQLAEDIDQDEESSVSPLQAVSLGSEDDSEVTPSVKEALRSISDHFRALSEDELATKLELAKVYYELGDNENARDLVTEIIDECGESFNDEASQMYRLLTGDDR